MTKAKRINLIAQSPALREQYAERRGLIPILTPEECEIGDEIIIPPEELADLKIDETYQRAEVEGQVRELTHVLAGGGVIPDPVSIAVRPDKSRYIVDGQQRYWAHLDMGKPMRAKLYYVRDRQAELKLFDALNHSVSLNATTRIKAWPGPAAELLRLLDEHPDSPIRARLGWAGSVKHNYPVHAVLRGIDSVLSGVNATGDTRRILTHIDAHWSKAPKWGRRAVLTFAELVAVLFPEGRAHEFKSGAAMALGRTCHLRWSGLYEGERQAWPYPTDSQIIQLQGIVWADLCHSNSTRWVAPAQAVIEERWPLPKNLKLASGGAR